MEKTATMIEELQALCSHIIRSTSITELTPISFAIDDVTWFPRKAPLSTYIVVRGGLNSQRQRVS